jgi:RimJ/RimL family protein N-acetyltransferase
MTEAVNGITSFAIDCLDAKRLEIRCSSGNEASIRVAERAGFTLEGTLRNAGHDERGQLTDIKVFAKAKGYEY